MGGCLAAVVVLLWNNYQSSKKLIHSFIEEHLTILLAVALDNWFELTGVPKPGTGANETTADDDLVTNFRDKIKDEFVEASSEARRDHQFKRLEDAAFNARMSGGTSGTTDMRYGRKRRDRNHGVIPQISCLLFERISVKHNNRFFFDSQRRAVGLEGQAETLPYGARLATADEVEIHSSTVDDILKGSDTCMLKDGVKYGPRFNNRLDRNVTPHKEFQTALVACSRYPPPDELPNDLKIGMIFDHFNVFNDSHLEPEEFICYTETLRREEFLGLQWPQIQHVLKLEYGIHVTEAGISKSDMSRLYPSAAPLDKDFVILFPTMSRGGYRNNSMDDGGGGSVLGSILSDSLGSDADDDDFQLEDFDQSADQLLQSPTEDHADGVVEDARDDVATTVNALKLKTVFTCVTQQYRGRSMDELITDVRFVAMKILETQLTMFGPIFGREEMLGVASRENSRRSDLSKPERGRFTSLLKTTYVECVNDLTRYMKQILLNNFDFTTATAAVSHFIDTTLAKQVGTKASRLLNSRITLTAKDVHSSTWSYLSHVDSPRSTYNICNRLKLLASERLKDNVLKLMNCSDSRLHMAAVTILLSETGVLLDSEVEYTTLEYQGSYMSVCLPSSEGCRRVISASVMGIRPPLDSAVDAATSVLTSHLWFDAFFILIRLLGVDMYTECFPGGDIGKDVHLDIWAENYITSLDMESHRQSDDDGFSPYTMSTARIGTTFFSPTTGPINTPPPGQTTEERKNLKKNLLKMRSVFDRLSNFSCFLPLHLADEAFLFLCDNKIHIASVVACLQSLGISSLMLLPIGTSLGGSDTGFPVTNSKKDKPVMPICVEAIEKLGSIGRCRNMVVADFDVRGMRVQQQEALDWTETIQEFRLGANEIWSILEKQTTSPHNGFMCRSRVMHCIKQISKLYIRKSDKGIRSGSEFRVRQKTSGVLDFEPEMGKSDFDLDRTTDLYIGFEIFHRVLSKTGFSIAIDHSKLLWILCCCALDDNQMEITTTFIEEEPMEMPSSSRSLNAARVKSFLPLHRTAKAVVSIMMKPVDASGRNVDMDSLSEHVHQFSGCFNLHIFRRFVRQCGLFTTERGVRAMWDEFHKHSMEVGEVLRPARGDDNFQDSDMPSVRSDDPFYIRLGMDVTGMDPTRGRVARIDSVRLQLRRMVMSGMCKESIKVLLQNLLQIDVDDQELNDTIDSLPGKGNAYGFIRLEDVGRILSRVAVEGMSLSMLKDLIVKMRLDFPHGDIKRMFDLMDLNNDKSLSLMELLGGFEVLIGMTLPTYICNAMGVTVRAHITLISSIVLALATFFVFVICAFDSFAGMKSGMGSAVQSLLALGGAVGLQSHASQDLETLKRNVYTRIEQLFGEALSARLRGTQEEEDGRKSKAPPDPSQRALPVCKPNKLRYTVPKQYLPDLFDPRPVVNFPRGADIRLQPHSTGRCVPHTLRWSIHPPLPTETGLRFDRETGVIEGSIPLVQSPMTDDTVIPRKTYIIVAKNTSGSSRTRITFQIVQGSK
eukprot:GHVO01017823.1.p1 GENE.GHVO01017823.1~~GHVO01017823.1.p1  ORF type:complete len:1511 (+),score=291.67 GHVO01017823.1:542-5074(+)